MEKPDLLLERYKVLETLGRGGFSEVFKAIDTKMERVVAIKTIPAGQKTAVRALREAKTVALLNHANIVTLYEFEEQPEAYYLIMEFIEGRNLAATLKFVRYLPVELALAIAVQICDALEYAHANDVIHRDIKPANLQVLPDGRVKVMDFGIARLRRAAHGQTATEDDEDVAGTFAYMSPEQTGGEMVDERSDIFSLGTLLYEAVTGTQPFLADTPAGTIYKILNEDPPPVHAINPQLPPALGQALQKAMAKFPEDRFVSAADFKAKLERCRQRPEAPADVAKDLLAQLREPRRSQFNMPFSAVRDRLAYLASEYRDTIVTTGFAAASALVAAWSAVHLPFYETRFISLFPIIIFFLSLFLPPIGFGVLLAFMSAGIWQISPYLGVAGGGALIVYWLTLGRGFPHIAVLPFLAPALAWLKAPFVFVLAAGLLFGPVLSAFVAGAGGLVLALAELIGETKYAWFIAARPQLVSKTAIDGQLVDFVNIIEYFRAQPWLLAQVAIWAAIALLVSLIRSLKTRLSFWLALVVGAGGLFFSYRLAPAALNLKLDFSRQFLQPMVFSLIIMAALLFIFFHPAKR